MKYLVRFYHTIQTPLFTRSYVVYQLIIKAQDDKDADIRGEAIFKKWMEEDEETTNEYITEIGYKIELLENFLEDKEYEGKFYE